MSALVRAMREKNAYALVRHIRYQYADPQMGLLWPCISGKAESLYYVKRTIEQRVLDPTAPLPALDPAVRDQLEPPAIEREEVWRDIEQLERLFPTYKGTSTEWGIVEKIASHVRPGSGDDGDDLVLHVDDYEDASSLDEGQWLEVVIRLHNHGHMTEGVWSSKQYDIDGSPPAANVPYAIIVRLRQYRDDH
ncbi:hypothetical protein SYNPS1DRAFT_30068 [Syncephalis pseudoplumigaleata]|uniref:Uncharacterized protein n=1 Tax=Syncephalis pseudoplumigaleata TaxID=1712513 RepID=A0A4P9YWE1_9FUNG|nr:hypothetical protein SYNPS1DRAFT_30068 [Syncephalis pseudoplumigaleata]|eukprot:RKP24165.1 hypothetical protein SYNPS1DRAFT_30068 [Syncephalis pseudoplumigaleata]